MKPPARGFIKVCGITRAEDARAAVDAGAHAIGLNLWPQSPRSVSLAVAAELAALVRGRLEVITVSVDATAEDLERARAVVQPDRLQVHGLAPGVDAARYPELYLGVGLRAEADLAAALEAPGAWVLVDAKDEARRGGTGRAAPVELAAQVCRARPTLLAGGLGPENVAAAIRATRPWGVDVASGVELRPGHKDPGAVRRFVAAARAAFAAE